MSLGPKKKPAVTLNDPVARPFGKADFVILDQEVGEEAVTGTDIEVVQDTEGKLGTEAVHDAE